MRSIGAVMAFTDLPMRGQQMKKTINVYLKHESRIRAMAQRYYAGARTLIEADSTASLAEEIHHEALARFDEIFAGFGDIGGEKSFHFWAYVHAGIALGLYLPAGMHGYPADDMGRITYELAAAFYEGEGARTLERATKAALNATRRELKSAAGPASGPDGWRSVAAVANGSDLGWDCRECGIVKLYKKFDAGEYVPYQCMLDYITYPMRNLGLKRTTTLVDADHCDFRVTLGGRTRLESFATEHLMKWGKI